MPLQDTEGQTFAEGQRVELVLPRGERESYGWRSGAIATVVAIREEHDVNVVGVLFAPNQGSNAGHDLEGRLAGDERTRGLWVCHSWLRILAPPEPETEDDAFQRFVDSLQGAGDVLVYNGQVYDLSSSLLTTPTEILSAQRRHFGEQYRRANRRFDEQMEVLRQRAEMNIEMPWVSLADVVRGLRLFKEDNGVHYLLPFQYAPEFLFGYAGQNEEEDEDEDEDFVGFAYHRLAPEHQERLKQGVVFDLKTVRGGGATVILRKEPSLERFYHYHSMSIGGDCLGSLQLHNIHALADVYRIHAQYQESLRVINGGSLAENHPDNLPSFEELRMGGTIVTKEEVGFWEESPPPRASEPPREEAPTGQFRVGQLVQVLSRDAHFPSDCIGSVGTVIRIGQELVRVHFLFYNADFVGRHHDEYEFLPWRLYPADRRFRRTRTRGAWSRMTWTRRHILTATARQQQREAETTPNTVTTVTPDEAGGRWRT